MWRGTLDSPRVVWGSDGLSDQSADGVSCSEASDYLSFLSVFPIAQASSTGEQLGLLNFQPNLRGVSLPHAPALMLSGWRDLALNGRFTVYHK